jgi:hypothetical protein
LKDDWYWIDPNGGKVDDAVQVFCRFEKAETCVKAKSEEIPLQAYPDAEDDLHSSISELAGLGRFDYQLEESQLAFLKMLSSHGRQQVTVLCSKASVVSRAGQRKNDTEEENDDAAILFSDNDKELTVDDPIFRYNVLQDDCQYEKSSIAETILEVKTRSQRLPIRDVSLSHLGSIESEVGVKLGEVCFS